MVTAVATQSAPARQIPGRRYDRHFFLAMSVLTLAAVFIGFAHTYYLAGVFRAHLPAPIIHVHGALFSSWILLFLIQTALVSARRVDIHRRLGLFGFGLAALMVVIGLLAAINLLDRNAAPAGLDPLQFLAVPLSAILVFSILVFFAYRMRKDSAAHKRLILIATIAMLDAAFSRWPVPVHNFVLFGELCVICMLVLVCVYDFFSLRTIHRATLWAGAFVIFVGQIRHPMAASAWWQHFAAWIQSIS